MSGSNMRAQLSLLFTDKTLYENFIVPCKNDRMLHSIIMKCLSAYYYNDDVRKMIEGVELQSSAETVENTKSYQDSINNIRDILAMQGFISKELENTMEDGIDDMTDILDHVNQTAEDYGVVKTTETEYAGKSMQLIAIPDKSKQGGTTQSSNNSDANSDVLVKMVTQMYSMMSKEASFKEEFGDDIVKIVQPVDTPTESLFEDDDTDSNVTVESTVEEDSIKKATKTRTVKAKNKVNPKTDTDDFDGLESAEVSKPPVVTTEEPKEEQQLGEAAGSLGELMGSLF